METKKLNATAGSTVASHLREFFINGLKVFIKRKRMY